MENGRNLRNRLKLNLAIGLTALALPVMTEFVKASPAEPALQATATATATPVRPDGWRGVHSEGMNDLWPDKNPLLHAVHGIKTGQEIESWAVGEGGTLAHYDGSVWRRDSTFENPVDGQVLNWRDVQMLSENDVWAVGGRGDMEQGILAHFDGQNWGLVTHGDLRLPELQRLNSISTVNEGDSKNFGWIVGNTDRLNRATILNFDNGNISLFTGTNNNSKNLNAVHTLSGSEAWAFGDGGRETWYNGMSRGWPTGHVNSTEGTAGVDMTSPLFGFYVAQNGRVAVYRGGCHDTLDSTPCWWINLGTPVLNPLLTFGRAEANFEAITFENVVLNFDGTPINSDLFDVDLTSPSEGWIVGEKLNSSSVVAVFDGTRYWNRDRVENDPGRDLDGLWMAEDGNRGFAVGYEGTILELNRKVPATLTPIATSTSTFTQTISPVPENTIAPTITSTSTQEPTSTWTAEPSATPDQGTTVFLPQTLNRHLRQN